MLAAELESPRILLLDANDTPVAVTGSTSCAVSVPTTHDANREASCYVAELINKKVAQVDDDLSGSAIRREARAVGGCAKKVSEWSFGAGFCDVV